MTSTIAGIILAAGESRRMGFPKPLLACHDGRTLLEHQTELFANAGIENIIVVVGAKADEIMAKHAGLKVTWAENKNWQRGQFSSLQTGLTKAVEMKATGAIILPVDVTGISKKTLETITKAASQDTISNAIVPEYRSNDGHPVYISKQAFEKLLVLDPADKNARLDVWLENIGGVKFVDVDDPAILKNVNTPEEWNSLSSPRK